MINSNLMERIESIMQCMGKYPEETQNDCRVFQNINRMFLECWTGIPCVEGWAKHILENEAQKQWGELEDMYRYNYAVRMFVHKHSSEI